MFFRRYVRSHRNACRIRLMNPWLWFRLAIITFAILGTFYWSFWTIPGIDGGTFFGKTTKKDNNNDGIFDIGQDRYNNGGKRRPSLPLQCHNNKNHNSFQQYNFDDIKTTTTTTINETNNNANTNRKQKYHICQWKNSTSLKECYDMLKSILSKQPSWVFLGDSNMAHLAYYISLDLPFDNNSNNDILNVTSRRNSCRNLNYFRLPPPSTGWKQPNLLLGEGPIGYGKIHPYCTDCQRCWNVLIEVQSTITTSSLVATTPTITNNINDNNHNDNNDNNDIQIHRMNEQHISIEKHQAKEEAQQQQEEEILQDRFKQQQQQYLEYLVVEYGRDVTLPTRYTNTTQETVTYYLSNKKPTVCFANAGLNDATIIPPISTDLYIHNIDTYIKLLLDSCQYVIWITIPAIIEDTITYPSTNNCKLQEWNHAVLNHITSNINNNNNNEYDNLYVIDIWEKSLITDHIGTFGLSKSFYATLASLIIYFMAGLEYQN